MHVIHNKVIDCSAMTAAECSDQMLVELQHGTDFKLRADTPDDTVHGSVSIVHNTPPEPHEIIVEIYDEDDAPTEGHRSTLKRPGSMPTEAAIRARLDA